MGVTIRLLGIGAAELESEGRRVYIDAFNGFNPAPETKPGDILLFTHADHDHFDAAKLLGASRGNRVIGPPSIAYPLLAGTGFDPALLQIVYPHHLQSPVSLETGGMGLKVYQTRHFIDWEPDHISYLIYLGGKRVYITGDSSTYWFDDPDMQGLDALVCSLMLSEKEKGDMDGMGCAMLHARRLRALMERLAPKMILCNHLIGCDWTVTPEQMRRAVENEGLENVCVPASESETITID